MTTLIDNIRLLPMDGREAIEDAVIVIQDQRIRYAGEAAGAPQVQPDRRIAGRGRIAMPGLVNAHTHASMTLLRGAGTDLPLERWLFDAIFPLEDKLNGEDIYWGAMLAITEMLRFGTTAFLDMYYFEEEVARAVEKTGIRAALSRGITGNGEEDAYRIDENEALFREWHGACDGRLQVMLGPHAEYTTNPDFLRQIVRKADELGCGVHIHVSETQSETDGCIQRHGKTPTQYLADLGLFDRHAVAAHCVVITPQDAEIFEKKGVYIAHNPVSNLKLGSGVMPIFPGLLPRTALGTDGAASNNNLNLFEEMRFAALLHKGVHQDPQLITATEAIRMATVNGASALGFSDVGTLCEGMKADLILVDTCAPHAVPCLDAGAHLAYSAQGSDVSLTMVDGRVLYEDGAFPGIDLAEVLEQADRCAKRIRNT